MACRLEHELEPVGFGFNKGVITNLLREKYGFAGVVCTDWGLLTDVTIGNRVMHARAWGVEHLSVKERALKALDAGVDQFGGEVCPQVLIDLVRSGELPESRIDESVRRILRDKFILGLFDDPYVDEEAAGQIVGQDSFRKAGELAQRKSIVLLKNSPRADGRTLPLHGRPRLFLENLSEEIAASYGEVVHDLDEADLAILRLKTPFEPRNKDVLDFLFHAGDLDFKPAELERILGILKRKPAIVEITLERPAVIPEIAASAAALLASFGASDAAVMDVIFGRFQPGGHLPFELPSSMDAVRQQKEDLPHDLRIPCFLSALALLIQ